MYLLIFDLFLCIYLLYMVNINMFKGLKIYFWGKRIWMVNYILFMLIWCVCIFVDLLFKKRERDVNLYYVYIIFKFFICVLYKYVFIFFKKNYILKDEIIILV